MTARRPRRAVHATLLPMLFAALMAVAGCAIQPDGQPRAIPGDQQGGFGADPLTGGATAGSSLVYLLAPREPGDPQLLRSVMRGVTPTLSAVLRALLKGPNTDEGGNGLSTAIPAGLELNSASAVGQRWVIDVNEGLDQLDAVELRSALAQIVATATAVDNVDAVKIRVNGEDRSWPRGDGTLTDQELTRYDFPGMVESTQPPYPSLSSTTR